MCQPQVAFLQRFQHLDKSSLRNARLGTLWCSGGPPAEPRFTYVGDLEHEKQYGAHRVVEQREEAADHALGLREAELARDLVEERHGAVDEDGGENHRRVQAHCRAGMHRSETARNTLV